MREQLLLLIRISKPEYNKCLYDEYKLYMNPQMSFNKVGLTDGQYDNMKERLQIYIVRFYILQMRKKHGIY